MKFPRPLGVAAARHCQPGSVRLVVMCLLADGPIHTGTALTLSVSLQYTRDDNKKAVLKTRAVVGFTTTGEVQQL